MKMPERSQILQSVDRFEKRDPELYRELRRKAAEPPTTRRCFQSLARRQKFSRNSSPCRLRRSMRAERARRGGGASARRLEQEGRRRATVDTEVTAYERRVAETIVRPSARPVLAIRDNKSRLNSSDPTARSGNRASTAPRPSSTS